MNDELDTSPRRGTTASLEVRVARLEAQYDRIDAKVDDLGAVVARVELNQKHSEEVAKLRYDGLDSGLRTLTSKTETFIDRIDKMISGEVPNRNAERQLEEWTEWRKTVNQGLGQSGELRTQMRLLGRLAIFLTGGSLIGTGLAIYAVFFK